MKKTKNQEPVSTTEVRDENFTDLLRAWGLVIRRFSNVYRSLFTNCKIQKGQSEILFYLKLENNQVEPSVIADFLMMPRQTMTSLLDGLEHQGLLERSPHPSDRRKILIKLSEKGSDFADTALGSIRSIEADAMRKLSHETLLTMLSSMETFCAAMESSIASEMKKRKNARVKHLGLLCASTAVVLLVGGCVSYKGQKERDAQVNSFMGTLTERREALPEAPLSLETSVELALKANYNVQLADLDVRMAALGKNISFVQFLPQVTATASWTGWDKQPMMQDSTYTGSHVSIGLPLLVPSLWFVYASKGEQTAQASARAHYVRQTIAVQTMTTYYNCMIAADEVAVVTKQLETAKSTAERVSGLASEGLARDWEAKQAAAQLAARGASLAQAKRNYLNRQGSLLNLLGLPPDYSPAGLKLSGEVTTDLVDTNSLENLILTALSSNPELEIADRNVVISENGVRKAIADFLPSLAAVGTLNWSSDTHTWTANRSLGLMAGWEAFNAFANVGLYKLAKAERTKSTLAREQTFLRIMLDVMVARHHVDTARDLAEVLSKTYEAANLKYKDYQARQKEGLVTLSDALDAEAEKSHAELMMLQSRYQERIARAALKLSMGVLDLPEDQRGNAASPDRSDRSNLGTK